MHKSRAAHLIILMSVGIFIFTSSASAHSWGNKCEATAPLEGEDTHCYMLAGRASSALGSIDEVAVTGALSYDWGESEVFASDEEWVSFSKYPGKWVEAGDMTGAGYSCCGVHAFWAAYGPKSQWHIYISPGEQPYDQYTNYLLYDTAQNGVWDVYVGCSPGSETWCQVAEYGGWSVRMSEQEAGQEVADYYEPHDAALDKVAYWQNGSSPWYAWSGVTVKTLNRNEERVPQICYKANHEIATPGDLEWQECGGEAPPGVVPGGDKGQAAPSPATETIIEEAPAGEILSAHIQAVRHGDAVPTGKYRAVKQIVGTGAIVEEYVGNEKPTPATLEYGLVGASSNANLSPDVGATASRSSHTAIASAASAGGNIVGEVVARVAAPRRPVEESPQSNREVKLKRYTADGVLSTSSTVTNKRGRFSFKARPGAYRLEVAECGPGGTRNARVKVNRTTHITIVCGK